MPTKTISTFKVEKPFYHYWSIDDEKIDYKELIYKPNLVIKYVDKSSEDYWDDYGRLTEKSSIVKNKLFQVINFLKTEKVKDASYNTEERINSINNAIKIYLNYIYNKGVPDPLQDKCLIMEDV